MGVVFALISLFVMIAFGINGGVQPIIGYNYGARQPARVRQAALYAIGAVTVAFTLGFAVVQIVVHMIYFLHMNGRVEGGWTLLALVFTVIVVVITLAGSLWVMYHLNTNMMPVHDMRQMP